MTAAYSSGRAIAHPGGEFVDKSQEVRRDMNTAMKTLAEIQVTGLVTLTEKLRLWVDQ